ncbi:MAG: LodA/GoxA family CTQ-dependent oxidase [Pseudomonadota bacterium]|nr:LodA/GoxA family CTQ-dependent oxidase [Pseudomonadota bacterium]
MPNLYRIHPTIGIARVGDSDSPDGYFVGPEAPSVPPSLNPPDAPHDPNAGYKLPDKDNRGRIKRQGARFRIYEYTLDDAGATTQVREITADDAQIEWEVHLANRKAAAPRFLGGGQRNEEIDDRSKLVLDAGPQRISGVGHGPKPLQGRFMDAINVPLGDLRTDSAGRLIVLGGFGTSQSPSGSPLVDFADNDGWWDDTSDGPVRATIQLNGSSKTIEADSAWAIVAPPDFAPPIENVVTLYDVVYDMMVKFPSLAPALAISDDTKVSFTKDIYPILRRASNMPWVSDKSATGHREPLGGHFISKMKREEGEGLFRNNKRKHKEIREEIFKRLRVPEGYVRKTEDGCDAPKEDRMRLMPMVPTRDPDRLGLSLTKVQYHRMERWCQGKFEEDWTGAEPTPLPLDELPDTEKPHALDRAALEACVGGPFFPGIEAGSIMLDEATYDEDRPFRINTMTRHPGELTERMAVPWQADFRLCEFDPEFRSDWWPGQRPGHVFRDQKQEPVEWVPSSWPNFPRRPNMVDDWSKLGFVRKEEGTDKYVENERSSNLQ